MHFPQDQKCLDYSVIGTPIGGQWPTRGSAAARCSVSGRGPRRVVVGGGGAVTEGERCRIGELRGCCRLSTPVRGVDLTEGDGKQRSGLPAKVREWPIDMRECLEKRKLTSGRCLGLSDSQAIGEGKSAAGSV